jgi:hypothetical protein
LRCAKRNERRERGFRDDLHTGLQTSGLRIGASFSTRGECYNVDVIRNAIGARERDEFMTSHWQDWPPQVLAALRKGVVIPAHPLALNAERKLDTRRQRALTRYYLDAGAGGLAVGVHTTQFAIREAGLFEPVLELAMRSATEWTRVPAIMIAGLVGRTAQAVKEAEAARALGYHAGLLSLAALKGASEDELIAHAQTVARELPLVGFYLQPAVGGLVLPVSFWRRFAAIENVVAIKVAPFNRYRTLDVVRGVVEADAANRVTLYTGNDDHIILDLVTPFTVVANGRERTVRIKGGLLGHWSVWVKRAVELLERIHAAVAKNEVSAELLALDAQVTDCNAAIFDAANDFHGVIAGCHEILRRQGLLEGIWCLDPSETLGSGQKQEIDRVCAAYPHLNDDAFVRANLQRWLS